jgi:hypothetical protein
VQAVADVAGAEATAVDGMAMAVRTTAARIILMVLLSKHLFLLYVPAGRPAGT